MKTCVAVLALLLALALPQCRAFRFRTIERPPPDPRSVQSQGARELQAKYVAEKQALGLAPIHWLPDNRRYRRSSSKRGGGGGMARLCQNPNPWLSSKVCVDWWEKEAEAQHQRALGQKAAMVQMCQNPPNPWLASKVCVQWWEKEARDDYRRTMVREHL